MLRNLDVDDNNILRNSYELNKCFLAQRAGFFLLRDCSHVSGCGKWCD